MQVKAYAGSVTRAIKAYGIVGGLTKKTVGSHFAVPTRSPHFLVSPTRIFFLFYFFGSCVFTKSSEDPSS